MCYWTLDFPKEDTYKLMNIESKISGVKFVTVHLFEE